LLRLPSSSARRCAQRRERMLIVLGGLPAPAWPSKVWAARSRMRLRWTICVSDALFVADCVNPWPLTRHDWRAVAERASVPVLEVEVGDRYIPDARHVALNRRIAPCPLQRITGGGATLCVKAQRSRLGFQSPDAVAASYTVRSQYVSQGTYVISKTAPTSISVYGMVER